MVHVQFQLQWQLDVLQLGQQCSRSNKWDLRSGVRIWQLPGCGDANRQCATLATTKGVCCGFCGHFGGLTPASLKGVGPAFSMIRPLHKAWKNEFEFAMRGKSSHVLRRFLEV